MTMAVVTQVTSRLGHERLLPGSSRTLAQSPASHGSSLSAPNQPYSEEAMPAPRGDRRKREVLAPHCSTSWSPSQQLHERHQARITGQALPEILAYRIPERE